jgi:hypothetical protein
MFYTVANTMFTINIYFVNFVCDFGLKNFFKLKIYYQNYIYTA